jgi:hypothetical protein
MKRLVWLGVGAVAGASGTVWAERKVRTQIEALQPEHLVVTAGHRAVAAGRHLVDAVLDGRDAMRSREFELHGRYDRPSAARRGAEVVEVRSVAVAGRGPAGSGAERHTAPRRGTERSSHRHR